MAIPNDPLFTQQFLEDLNNGLRGLGLSVAAMREIAAYLGEDNATVAEWCYSQNTIVQTRTEETTQTIIIKWEQGFTRPDLLDIIENSRRNFTFSKLKAELQGTYNIRVPSNYNKQDLIAYFRRSTKDWKKSELGALMDRIQPRTISETTTEEITEQIRLADALDPEVYRGRLLSQFQRGTVERMKADLVLALNGEVIQTPQAGERESSYLRRASSLSQAEEATLWPLRWGHDVNVRPWPDEFTAEMWFRATLTPGPDIGQAERKGGTNWYIQVEFYQIYEAVELVSSFGWPTRKKLKLPRARTEQEKLEKIREKEGYEKWKRARAKKAAQKRKANR